MLGRFLDCIYYASELDAADKLINNQHQIASPDFIAEAREYAENEGFLDHFNQEINGMGTPLTIFKVVLAIEKSKKAIGRKDVMKGV